jgi:acyl-coenzyme A synthetase/AMP-(fatty) acid ligase
MKMPADDARSLWQRLSARSDLAERFVSDRHHRVSLSALAAGSSLGPERAGLRGRSVLLVTKRHLAAALAMIELDGIARRIVLCPSDLPAAHLASIAETAEADAVLSDEAAPLRDAAARPVPVFRTCVPALTPAAPPLGEMLRTEWVLLTSGTTGTPKLVVHDRSSLGGPALVSRAPGRSAVWSTFYDIRRYGGLAIFFRALLGAGSLVLSDAAEETGDFLERIAKCGVTHISGTPSHWRRALMSPAARGFAPRYVRLSGEIADQALLDRLRAFWPEAGVTHAFASTEAGLAFDVGDGRAGFPAALIGGAEEGDVRLRIADGSLRVRSPRMAHGYLGRTGEAFADADGFVDTRDLLELRGDRYFFVGRRDGIVNVGGIKVHPEEVEGVINAHPAVRMSLVRSRRSPFTGAVVVADVVSETARVDHAALEREILALCRENLPRHKVPVAIRFVASLAIGDAGKLSRHA